MKIEIGISDTDRQATADLPAQRMVVHQKNARIPRGMLDQQNAIETERSS